MKAPRPFPVWITRDRRKIPVRKMESSHILNTIRYLQRTSGLLYDPAKAEICVQWVAALSKELYRRRDLGEVDLLTLSHETEYRSEEFREFARG